MKNLRHLKWLLSAVFLLTGYSLQMHSQEVDDLQEYLVKNPLFYPLYTENATDFGDVLQHRGRLPFPVSITPHLFVF